MIAPVPDHRPLQQSDDIATVVAVGVIAATLAAFCHETMGHGIGCIAVGGRITLLTSIWFRCQGATSLTDAGGAIASVLFGVLALSMSRTFIRNPALHLASLLTGALSLFWTAAQLIVHPALDRDDWHFVALSMHWPWEWRPAMLMVGVAVYVATMRWSFILLRHGNAPDTQNIRHAYVASAVSAALAGLMWRPEPVRSAMEALLTLGVAPLGLLAASRLARPQAWASSSRLTRSWYLIAISLTIFVTFTVVQGRGIGTLANVPLDR